MDVGGRNEIIIDWEKVDQFLMAGCTGTEVAAYFGCHPDTLYNKCKEKFKMGFSQYCQEKRSKGDNFLKNAQYKNAMGGNTTMQIWLGKQRLDQREPSSKDAEAYDEKMKLAFTALMNQMADQQKFQEFIKENHPELMQNYQASQSSNADSK